MAQQRNLRRNWRGMTLVELMMVISIMTILMAVAIPLIRPAFQDRQLREASRQINAFCAGARRAAETGRPHGVWIEAAGVPGEPQYAVRLYTAEVSPNFTGEVLGARATVEIDSTVTPALQVLNFGDSDGHQQPESQFRHPQPADRVDRKVLHSL